MAETSPTDAALWGQAPVETDARELLRHYEHIEMELAALILTASHGTPGTGDSEFGRGCQDLLSRLSGDRIYLMVIGESGRGKSTLMNAILRMERPPAGNVPVTSVITSVADGSRECVRLRLHGTNLVREVPVSELESCLTEKDNPGNRLNIRDRGNAIIGRDAPPGVLFCGYHGIRNCDSREYANHGEIFARGGRLRFCHQF
jgi:hypothetical protein